MTEAKVFQYRTPLSRKMAAPGGKSVNDALNAAEDALEGHREAAMQSLGDMLGKLEAASARRGGEEIYEQAAALLDMSGFFDTGPLHPAVFSLCEISSRMDAEAWDWAPIEVHLRAIRMILASGCRSSNDADLLLEGLASIREHAFRKSLEAPSAQP